MPKARRRGICHRAIEPPAAVSRLREKRLLKLPQLCNYRPLPAAVSSLHRLHAARTGRISAATADDRVLERYDRCHDSHYPQCR